MASNEALSNLGVIAFILVCFVLPMLFYIRWIKRPKVPVYQSQLQTWIDQARIDFGIIIMTDTHNNVKYWVKNPDNATFVTLFYDEQQHQFAVEVLGGYYDAGKNVRLVSDRINRLNALAERLNACL